ncbi:MAG: chemotaxis protein CheA [Planctomycetia bacterium]|nr:chemotaxis protein CheA [Planctomycetia bacterium]
MNVASQDQIELLQDFADEALTSLRSLAQHLAAYRAAPAPEPINAVFRGIHSLKGNAGFFGLIAIKTFAHTVENTLDEIRAKLQPISEELERAFTSAFDLLEEMVTTAVGGVVAEETSAEAQRILDEIETHAAPRDARLGTRNDLARILRGLAGLNVAGLATPSDWLEAVADTMLDDLHLELYEQVNAGAGSSAGVAAEAWTPAQFAALEASGSLTEKLDDLDDILHLFLAFDEGKYLPETGHNFVVAAKAMAVKSRAVGRESFATALETTARTFETITASPIPLDSTLLAVVWDELWPELAKLTTDRPSDALAVTDNAKSTNETSNIVVSHYSAATAAVAPPAQREKENSGRLVRVKEERLDEFLNLVARLFITGEMFKDVQSRMAESRQLKPMVEELRGIIRNFSEQAHALQKGLFSLRRVPVVNLFAKYPGMARNLGRQLGKEVDVQLLGEELEIDKVLLEDLDAPLTHILRNAVDHGIDDPESRENRGASRCGKLTLKAEVTRTHVRILITDDGRGIDPKKLKTKAREKRLLSDSELDAMSDEEAVQLIFHPGFSTAEKLSEVSGRGVGLDVVRNAVRKHRGEVYVSSQINVGTTFRLEVPLREAVLVIDGLMVRNEGEEFVIPFEFIREITQLRPDQLAPLHGAEVATIRGTVYDARRLSTLLNGATNRSVAERPMSAIVVGTHYGQLCVLVDQVLGTRKVVVNGLNDVVTGSPAVAGVAQLGGGHLALVLSVPEIINELTLGSSPNECGLA